MVLAWRSCLSLLLCCLLSVAVAAETVTYSGLRFNKCDPKEPYQKFTVEQYPAGTGEIHDKGTGRCLSVRDCINKQPASDPIPYKDIGQVVLDKCDAGPCDGKNSKWVAVASQTVGWNVFESRDIGTSEACFTLNAVGDGGASTNHWPLVAWGTAGACDHTAANNQFKWDKDTGQIRLNFMPPLSGCTDATSCCLCVAALLPVQQ
eukprot:COSAG05_NODE_2585_length_2871_cov_167.033550_2_plen_205_part_00